MARPLPPRRHNLTQGTSLPHSQGLGRGSHSPKKEGESVYTGFSPALISSPDLIGVLVYIKRESNNTAKNMGPRKTLLSTIVDILSCLPGVFLFRGRDRAPHVRGHPTLAGTLGDLRVCPVHVSPRRPWSWSRDQQGSPHSGPQAAGGVATGSSRWSLLPHPSPARGCLTWRRGPAAPPVTLPLPVSQTGGLRIFCSPREHPS